MYVTKEKSYRDREIVRQKEREREQRLDCRIAELQRLEWQNEWKIIIKVYFIFISFSLSFFPPYPILPYLNSKMGKSSNGMGLYW